MNVIHSESVGTFTIFDIGISVRLHRDTSSLVNSSEDAELVASSLMAYRKYPDNLRVLNDITYLVVRNSILIYIKF
jgi:hypothetical protein